MTGRASRDAAGLARRATFVLLLRARGGYGSDSRASLVAQASRIAFSSASISPRLAASSSASSSACVRAVGLALAWCPCLTRSSARALHRRVLLQQPFIPAREPRCPGATLSPRAQHASPPRQLAPLAQQLGETREDRRIVGRELERAFKERGGEHRVASRVARKIGVPREVRRRASRRRGSRARAAARRRRLARRARRRRARRPIATARG